MNGFEVAEAVATLIDGAGLSMDPNAEARIAPIVKAEDLPDDEIVRTHVLLLERTTERPAKRRRWRVFRIAVVLYRRVAADTTKFKEFLDLCDEVDDLLATTAIAGVQRRETFTNDAPPYVLEHARDNGIATSVLDVTYELTLEDTPT